jgi:hypothetical protein
VESELKTYLVLRASLASAHLLCLEVLIQEVQGGLIGLCTAHDREHAFASLVVRGLGNADSSTRSLADFADLATCTANDTADHVGRDANVLGLQLLSVLIVSRWTTTLGSIRVGAAIVILSWGTLTEVSTVACSHDTIVVVIATSISSKTLTHARALASTGLGSHNRVVKYGSSASLPVINQALADLPDSLLDTLWSTLNFNNALGRLRKHLLLGHHANTGDILDVLNLQALSANDRAHLIVGDQQLDGWGKSVNGSSWSRRKLTMRAII